MFIVFCILAGIALLAAVAAIVMRNQRRIPSLVAAAAGVLAAITLIFASSYTQGVGEAKVLKSWSGEVVGQDLEPGFSWKSPLTTAENFNIRNQSAAYMGDGSADNVRGPQITVTDKDNVRSDVDVTVLYSIKPDAVSSIYLEHRNQETFEQRVVEQDVRSVVRSIPGKFSTGTLLNDRNGVEAAIVEALESRWADKGVILESVALQEVRPPGDVLQRFADAQAASSEVAKQESLLKAAEVSAKQKVVQANAEAEANRIINASLTDNVLKLRQQDTLRAIGEKGNLVVVPEGSTPMVQAQK